MTVNSSLNINFNEGCSICLEPLDPTGLTVSPHFGRDVLDKRVAMTALHSLHKVCFDGLIERLIMRCPSCRVKMEGPEMCVIRDRMRADLAEADADLDRARADVDWARAEVNVARAKVGVAKAKVGVAEADLAEAEAGLARAEAGLAEANLARAEAQT